MLGRWAKGVVCLCAFAMLSVGVGQSFAYERGGPSIITKNPTIGKRGLYVIQQDDTLWDLCDLFFGEPWYWPMLWSYNPQLTNPHFIYPGDLIQIREPRPPEKTTVVWSDSRYSQKPITLEVLSRYVGYLPEKPFRVSGAIKWSREEHDTLGVYDEIYLEFGPDMTVSVGDEFTIYRDEGELNHPDDDEVVGHKIRHLGVAKVLGADTHYIKAIITQAYEEIYRGDLVTGIFPHSWVVAPVTNSSDVEATIVDFHDPIMYGAQLHYLYLDRGRNDGVERGNRFVVQRRGDGLWKEENEDDDQELDAFPWERVGEVMVVEAFEDTSIAVVASAIKALEVGEHLVMKKDY